MPYAEEDFLALSALQHYWFCQRQCAFIHVERQWTENRLTAEGRILHQKVDTSAPESRKDMKIEYSVPLRSFRLGLIGYADVVEFHRSDKKPKIYHPFPVEYKRGRPKKDACDRIQLCAQALCLEEMMSLSIPSGAIYYGKNRRRESVLFDDKLRRQTEQTAQNLHELIQKKITPKAVYSKRCQQCSFLDDCLPEKLHIQKSVRHYLSQRKVKS